MIGYHSDGRRKYRSFYGKTQTEVKSKAKAFWEAQAAGLVIWESKSFTDFADLWFEHHKANVSLTTQESYRYTLRIIKDSFVHFNVADVRPYDVEVFLNKLHNNGYSYSSVTKCKGMLFQIFKMAEANDIIRKNPVSLTTKLRWTEPRNRRDAFTSEEIAILMDQLPDSRIGWSIKLLLGTGMRPQELLALEPRHIETDGSCIHIRQAIKMVKGKPVVGTPKSLDSYRDVPVPVFLRACAVKLRSTDTKYIWELKFKDVPCNPSTFNSHFQKTLESIPGIRVLTPHSCRHTYVSQLQALGVDIATIQSLVGHADIDMTRHYLHVQENIRQDAIARFGEAFSVS